MMVRLFFCLFFVSGVNANAQDIPESGTFEARWTVTGQVETLPFGGGRETYNVRHQGELFLTHREGMPRALTSDCLGFGERGLQYEGRCVFTDSDGDQIFAKLTSVRMTPHRPVTDSLVGGTGKYQNIGGELSSPGWRYGTLAPGESLVQAYMDVLSGSWRIR
jgi:hypothetical protein